MDRSIPRGFRHRLAHIELQPFILCLAVLLASTLLFFLGTAPQLVVAARALQGASQAFVWVSGMALLASRVSKADNLGLFSGYILMSGTIGELVGPLVGGPLYDAFGHWAVFAVIESILAVDVAMRLMVTAKRERGLKTGIEQASETDALLRDGRHGDEADSDTTPSPTDTAIPSILGWNCLASIMAEAVAITIRCGLETVRFPHSSAKPKHDAYPIRQSLSSSSTASPGPQQPAEASSSPSSSPPYSGP
ncbi:hypothetical protein XA68_13490 [Ophiocordyceps unilateralis]|uniref:Major facilitator superfamily (MFS) profile domain-containing protein n=1 Tax=Ophiocordyceps unilateralis TaxID=268505 RepID=A0A2A9PBI0_OPHUN|nr:hypothetical protein XA68_13490 [Ophiocordyceps unilateralis]